MADPYLSEIKYLGGASEDFIEVAVDAGSDVAGLTVTIYHENGSIRSESNISVLEPTTVNGKDVYVIEAGDDTNFNGVAYHNAVSLSQDGTVYSFVSFDDTSDTVTATEGDAAGLTSTDIGTAGKGSSLETDDGGQTYFVQDEPNPWGVPCLMAGTFIETDVGEILIENLKPGMLLKTADQELRPLKRVFMRKISARALEKEPKLCPVRITAGALGADMPKRDLLVSRQHRMLMSSTTVERMFNAPSVLISACRLARLPGIYVDTTVTEVTYYHLLFDDHEVIYAEGAPTESLFLGAEALATLEQEVIDEIQMIFPHLSLPLDETHSKQHIPTLPQQSALVTRHLKNQQSFS